ncbi:hypothetical protein [Pseudonocardia nigra]|uniref:hypothetical protein n=1 Tax=Pseudonocardia nigra TaxID=1921578 RepID=UPI001C5CC91D|nr:hypothetical protein [Pseudonocardia nigra]
MTERPPPQHGPQPAPLPFATLADWVEGRLGPAEAAAVSARYEQAGPDARAAVSWLRWFGRLAEETVLAEPPPAVRQLLERRLPPPEDGPRAGDEQVAAVLLWDSRRDAALAGTRAPAGRVGGAAEMRHLLFQAAGIDIALDLHPIDQRTLRLEGQILPPPAVVSPITAVQLLRGRRAVADALLDDLGMFCLERIEAGSYQLMLLGGSLQIAVDVVLELEPPQ